MRCPDPDCACENPDTAVFCNACGKRLAAAGAKEATVSPALSKLLPHLPHVLAVPLLEYAKESVPYVKLHRMCDAAELLARFLASALLADLLRRGKGRFPRSRGGACPLESALAQHLAAPTFASWRVMLEEASKHYSGGKGGAVCFVKEMPDFARRLVQELGGNADDPLRKLIPCRNLAAHFGRMPDGQAQKLLNAHGERFGRLFEVCRFLGDYPLVARGTGSGLVKLMGTAIPASLVVLPKATMGKARAGRLYMLSRDRKALLDLSPLHTYEPVRVRAESAFREAQSPPDRVPQVYFRAERDLAYLEYLTFAASAPHGQDAHGALERFKKLFRLDEWREEVEQREEAEAAGHRYAFRRLRQGLLAGFVGRGECLEKMSKALVAKREGGIVWMTGKAGSGKSALMAKFLELGKLGIRQPERWVTVFHFFRAQEGPSCSRPAFLENALARLLPTAGITETIEEEPRAREEQFARILGDMAKKEVERPWPPRSKNEGRDAKPPFRRGILLFLDGLDELLAFDPGFPDFVLRSQAPGVVWLCAGQPLPSLRKAFAPSERCTHVFPAEKSRSGRDELEGGVPGMTRGEVYEYLISECRSAGYQLMKRDAPRLAEAEGGDPPFYPNPFLDALVRRSQGLPLYLYLLAQDVREGRLTFLEGQERDLPTGLQEYYDRLLERMSIGDLKAVMTPIVMRLAMAKAPLTSEALYAFLGDVPELRGAEGKDLLESALAFGHVMLRRTTLPAREKEGASRIGYAIYHDSFKEHLLSPGTKAVKRSRQVAGEAIEKVCACWEKLRDSPDVREYCMRFGPAHLGEAKRWQELETLLTTRDFVEAKCAAGLTYELVGDFDAALKVLPARRATRRIIGLLGDAIRRDVQFIARHPSEVFPCLWNSCWWYDCPATAGHYYPPGGRRGGAPWKRRGPKLHKLMESWRDGGRNATAGRRWLRPMRPPSSHLGAAQKAVLRGHAREVECVAYSPNGRRIASGSWDSTVRIWDAATGKELCCLSGHEGWIQCVAYSPDGRRIVSASRDGTARIWDAETGEELGRLVGHDDYVESVAYAPGGRWIVSGSADRTIRIWDAESGKERRCLHGHKGRVGSVAYSPDGQRIASGSRDDTVRVWSVRTGKELLCLRGHGAFVDCVAFSPDGRRVVSAGRDKTVRIWDSEDGRELHCLKGHENVVAGVACSPDGRRIASAARDTTVRVWDAAGGGELRCFRGHPYAAESVAFSPDGGRLASASWDMTIRLWDVDASTEQRCLRGHEDWVRDVACSPDGRRIATGSTDGTVRIWDAGSGVELHCLRGHVKWVTKVRFSPDGGKIVSAADDATLRVWDAHDGGEAACLRGHDGMVEDAAFSPDGGRIASASRDMTARIWDTGTGEELCRLEGHEDVVACVAFDPAGRRVLTGGHDMTARVWDAKTGRELLCLRGHGRPVESAAFSPDGRRIVTGSSDNMVRIWDAQKGRRIARLSGHEGGVTAVAFGPAGRMVVSASRRDRTTRVWDVKARKPLDVLPGVCDVQAAAAKPGRFPCHALSSRLETVVVEAGSGKPVARFPIALEHVRTHPSGRMWAGADGAHLYILALECSGKASEARPAKGRPGAGKSRLK